MTAPDVTWTRGGLDGRGTIVATWTDAPPSLVAALMGITVADLEAQQLVAYRVGVLAQVHQDHREVYLTRDPLTRRAGWGCRGVEEQPCGWAYDRTATGSPAVQHARHVAEQQLAALELDAPPRADEPVPPPPDRAEQCDAEDPLERAGYAECDRFAGHHPPHDDGRGHTWRDRGPHGEPQ